MRKKKDTCQINVLHHLQKVVSMRLIGVGMIHGKTNGLHTTGNLKSGIQMDGTRISGLLHGRTIKRMIRHGNHLHLHLSLNQHKVLHNFTHNNMSPHCDHHWRHLQRPALHPHINPNDCMQLMKYLQCECHQKVLHDHLFQGNDSTSWRSTKKLQATSKTSSRASPLSLNR